jgi:hypothetical protein
VFPCLCCLPTPQLPQAQAPCRFRDLTQCLEVPCDYHTYGMAVCPDLQRVVTSSTAHHRLSFFRILPGGGGEPGGGPGPLAELLVVVHQVGTEGSGPLQFSFMLKNAPSGRICFTAGARCTLLVADAGNRRVQEVGSSAWDRPTTWQQGVR